MKYLNSLIIVALSIFIGTIGLNAEEISQTYDFDTPTVKHVGVYSEICIPGTRNVGTPGEPLLPVKGVELLLPPGQCIGEVEIIPGERITLPGSFNIHPAEREYPLSYQGPFVPTPPNPEIYGSDQPYPGKLLRSHTTQSLCGYNIAILAICPMEYIPVKCELAYYSNVEVRITTTTSERSVNATSNFLRTTPQVQARVRRIVDNPEDISGYGFRDNMGDEEIDYVIITNDELSSSFETLREFKNRRGIRTVIKTIEEIYIEYSGIDNQDKIRNFIIDAYQNWNTEYVLLGGDDNIIPHRGLYATAYGYTDNDIPADIYYGALDGNWNDDGDSRWGEPNEADLETEVHVGRAAVETTTEADNFINKVIMYQQSPVVDECTTALMVGELLWYDPTWGGDYKDEIKDGSDACGYTTVGFPEWFNVETLYDRDLGYEWSAMNDLLPILNDGVNIVNHLGHSWIDYVMRFYDYQITDDNFTNNGTNHSFYIIYTQGCYPNAFDHEAISERFTGIQNAAVAFIGNSRYGWGMHNSTCGSSQYFDRQFFDALFGEDIYNIGKTNDDSKVDNIWIINQGAIRWCYYELCLLGDPQMPIWTNTPESLIVNHSPVCFIGSSQFEVTVPGVEGALVGLFKDGELLGRAYTDATGLAIVLFDIIPLTPGEMCVTVTAHNYLPYQRVVPVIPPEGPYVIYDSYEIDDSQGNNNGVVNPGETIAMSLTLKNVGIETAFNVYATLSTADTFVTIGDGVQFFGDIDSSGIATSVGPYTFEVASTCPDQHVILFDVIITADAGYEWSSVFTVEVLASDIVTSSDTLNFGEVYIGYPESLALTVSNWGSEILNVTDIYSDNSDFSVDYTSFSLGGGDSQDVMVAFSPSDQETISGTLFIMSDDPDEPIVTVALEGKGLIPPDISITPDSLCDALYAGGISTQWLTISNTAVPDASDLIFVVQAVDTSQAARAASFDGVDDYVHIPDSDDINLGTHDKRTVQAWFKVNDKTISSRKQVVYEEGGAGKGLNIYIHSGLLYVGGWNNPEEQSNWSGTYLTTNMLDSGRWHNVALVLDGTSVVEPDAFKAYLDGQLFGSGDGSQLWKHGGDIGIGAVNNKTQFHDGDFSGENGHWFGGLIDELRIFNRSLTQEEIQANMHDTLTGSEPGLVAYWNFNGVNPWDDLSGHGNDGTPHGGVDTAKSTAPICSWLSATPSSDSLSPGSSMDDTVTFDAAGLDADDYFAEIIVTSNDPDEQEIIIPARLTVVPDSCNQRGDVNCDGSIDVGDVVHLINCLFISGPCPIPPELGDVNCDGVVDIGDVVYLINYLFFGGPPPCEGKGALSLRSGLELYKDKAPAQVGLSSPSLSKEGIVNVSVFGKFDVDIAGVQLEIKYDPEKITLLEPALTSKTEGLTIYSSSDEGIHKIDSLRSLQVGILDLSGEHYIPAGSGALVTLRMKGSDLNSLEITKAILVDRDAQKIPVEIVSEMKKSKEDFTAGKSVVPQEFSLSQNYPNPFNPETEISYALPNACHVKLSIYNLLGERIRSLVDENQAAGHKTAHWDGTNEEGSKVASGVYFYKMQAGEFTESKKMILMK